MALAFVVNATTWTEDWDGSDYANWVDEHNTDGACDSWEEASGAINISCKTGSAHSGGGMTSDVNLSWSGLKRINFTFMISPNSNNDVGDTGLFLVRDICYTGTDCRDTSYYWIPVGRAIANSLKAGCGWWDNAAVVADDASTTWHCGWEHAVFRNSTAFYADDVWYDYTQDIDFDTGETTVYIDGDYHGSGTVGSTWLNGIGTQGKVEMHLSIYPYNANNQSLVFKDFVVYEEEPACVDTNVATSTTLTGDVTGVCYNFTASDIVFDCDGYSVNGYNETLAVAFSSVGNDNVTIKNCVVSGFVDAFYFENSDLFNFSNDTFVDYYGESVTPLELYVVNIQNSDGGYVDNLNFSNVVFNVTTLDCYSEELRFVYFNRTVYTSVQNFYTQDSYLSIGRDQDSEIAGCQVAREDDGYVLWLEYANDTMFVGTDVDGSDSDVMFFEDDFYSYRTFIDDVGLTDVSMQVYGANSTINNSRFVRGFFSVVGADSTIQYSNYTNVTLSMGGVNSLAEYNIVDVGYLNNAIVFSSATGAVVQHNHASHCYASSSTASCIRIGSGSGSGGLIYNNTIEYFNYTHVLSGNNTGGGIAVNRANAKIIGNTIRHSLDGNGISVYFGANNVLIANNTIENITKDYDIHTIIPTGLHVINNSFDKSKLGFYQGFKSYNYRVFVGDYVIVNVSNGSGAYEGVNVSVYNVTGDYNHSLLTNSSGEAMFEIIEYEEWDLNSHESGCVESATNNCFTPHNFTANDGSLQNSTRFNVNQTDNILLTLYYAIADPCTPTVGADWWINEYLECFDKDISTLPYDLYINVSGHLLINNTNLTTNRTFRLGNFSRGLGVSWVRSG